ncbi:MAG: hypothetical protein RKP73_17160 [Candidatus Contendobacter sp.]|nr:hypothetical protein [Candidatus Contendobacter sp.]
MKLYLEMELLSDTCFAGSGGGRVGTVDTELETDPRTRLPIVRGRTLKGLLLEELAQILRALEKHDNGPWHEVATRLFGTPLQAERGSLTFGDGHLPDDLQATVRGNWHQSRKRQYWTQAEVLAALTTVRHQTKIDPESGAPEPHSLRSARLLRAGLRLRAPVDAHRPLDSAEQALIAACAVAVNRAGLHRNHGWGEVRVRVLDERKQDVTAIWLVALRRPPTESPAAEPPANQPEPSIPSATNRRVISYRLTLTAPAVLAMAGGETSTVETRLCISGSTVLGALAWRWLAQRPACPDPAGNPEFRRYFLDSSVRWLNAYAESYDGKRLLPCPSSMVNRKGESNPAFDQVNPCFENLVKKEPNTQWKPLESPFVQLREIRTEPPEEDEEDEDFEERKPTEYQLSGRKPSLTTRLHHTRDDREAGRSKNGVMFSYVALDAGERFIGHILCETVEDAAIIRALLESGPLPLGRSRTATYGGWAQVEILNEAAAESWREAPERQEFTDEEQEQGRLVVTLLSDYLGVNDHGLPDPLALEQDLGKTLGIDQAPTARFLGSRSVTGYVSHWRMPRPSHPAVTAGSVLVYEDARPEPARLAELLWQGIGVRRTEGFGRVTVQWHGALEIQTSEEEENEFLADSESEAPSSPPSPELVFLQRNLLRNALGRALIHRAVEDANGVIRPPSSPALIGRLRARIRTAAAADEVKNFLLRASYRPQDKDRPQDKGLKKAGQAFTRARRGGKTLLDWLIAWMLGEDRNPPEWISCREVTEVCTRLKLDIDLLGDDDRWWLLQTYLDAFCEQLRRCAQKQAVGATARR